MALLTAADFTAIVLADALKAIALALSDDAVEPAQGSRVSARCWADDAGAPARP